MHHSSQKVKIINKEIVQQINVQAATTSYIKHPDHQIVFIETIHYQNIVKLNYFKVITPYQQGQRRNGESQ